MTYSCSSISSDNTEGLQCLLRGSLWLFDQRPQDGKIYLLTYVARLAHDGDGCSPRWHIETHEMAISLNLDEEQSARLEERARMLGVDARELAKAAVNDLLTRPADEFDRASQFVLEKNRELYRRLS